MKDAYYFSHDSNARNDQRLMAVRMKYGLKGYGIYFCLIEILRDADGYRAKPDWEAIAYDLREDAQAIVDVASNYGLFVVNADFFYSESLFRRMKELDEKREKRIQAGRIGGLASASKRQAIVNDSSSSKVKESKVNKINNILRFAPPTQEECFAYFKELNSSDTNASKFYDYYCSVGWKVGGRAAMKDWRAAARRWVRVSAERSPVENSDKLKDLMERAKRG